MGTLGVESSFSDFQSAALTTSVKTPKWAKQDLHLHDKLYPLIQGNIPLRLLASTDVFLFSPFTLKISNGQRWTRTIGVSRVTDLQSAALAARLPTHSSKLTYIP